MDNRLYSGDYSLNTHITHETESAEWQDMLADEKETQDIIIENIDGKCSIQVTKMNVILMVHFSKV